jgi:hypothetical protein
LIFRELSLFCLPKMSNASLILEFEALKKRIGKTGELALAPL